MSQAVIYKIHSTHPESHKIAKVVASLEEGAIMLYPSDTIYAFACDPRNKAAIERLRSLKPHAKWLTLLCPSLGDISTYAHVDDRAFKLMKSLTPGPYTFILKGTREMPRLVQHPKRKTAGMRIPGNAISQAILTLLGHVLATTSATTHPEIDFTSREALIEHFARQVDIVIDDGKPLQTIPSTVIDLTEPRFEVLREGQGMESLASHLH